MRELLIVDDKDNIREILSEELYSQGYKTTTAASGEEAFELINNNHFDLIITDMKMGDINGIDVLKLAKKKDPRTIVIIMTAYGTIDTAVEAMKFGAWDFLTKPVSIDELELKLKKGLEYQKLSDENLRLRGVIAEYKNTNIIGNSPAIKSILNETEKIARSNATVLIKGESGTGKELIAERIHNLSSRKNMPLVKVACSAIPETLLESDLFGHEKGSFTGAYKKKVGKFQIADGGSIFLDEIGDISPIIQAKLLRVLQEKQFNTVGGIETISTDVRIISATNRNLEQLVKENKFRLDLFYRLNVIPIVLPPLRERLEDIDELFEYFLEHITSRLNIKMKGYSKDILPILKSYSWPGNIRELENTVERMLVLNPDKKLTKKDIPEAISIFAIERKLLASNKNLQQVMDEFEKRFISMAYIKNKRNQTKTAIFLGINRSTLQSKLKKYNI